jgi:acyl-coenzyme A synthetase/AMP-(fatty) acid ligase
MTEVFNASTYLLDRHLDRGDGDRLALTGVGGDLTYAALHDRVVRTAAGLRALGLRPEQRLMMFMSDSPDFVTLFLAALRIGAVPVPASTMLHTDGLSELLRDARAALLAVSPEFGAVAEKAVAQAPELAGVLVGDGVAFSAAIPVHRLADVGRAEPDGSPYATTADSPAFWLYTSGTTGTPKAAMHRHGAIQVVCETYGAQVLGVRPEDRCLSAAKAFFAYGLGNSILFRRRFDDPGTRAGPAGTARRACPGIRRDIVLRRSHLLRQHAARRPPTRSPDGGATERVGRRTTARRALPTMD